MKKILCFVMCMIICLAAISPSLLAAEADTQPSKTKILNAVTYSCVYDVKQNRVVIDGNVYHDFMISHDKYRIKIYSIMPGYSVESVISNADIKPQAESDMTMKFTFYINVEGILDRYSKYAIVLCSPNGEQHLAAEPMLPSISSTFAFDAANRIGYKGILTDNPVDIGDSGAGTVIVDIDISKTVGDAADSILYPMGDSYIHLRKSYITHIDKQIMSASVSEKRVYVRLLLQANDKSLAAAHSEEQGKYSIPNLYSADVLEYVYTLSCFLAERYNGTKGEICGIIPGTRIDDTSVNSVDNWNVDDYAERYTLYLVVVGNALRAAKTDFDIVIPISDRNDYSSETYVDYDIRASKLLEKIIYMLDKNVSGDFGCSVMLESEHSPLEFSVKGKKNTLKVKNEQAYISADNIDVFSTYLSNLSSTYMSVPSNIIYLWTPESTLLANALGCTYIYSYTKLSQNSMVSSFAASLDKEQYDGMRNIVRYIDTQKADETNLAIAEYFGFASWTEIFKSEIKAPVLSSLFDSEFTYTSPNGIKGEFQYMDFTASEIYSIMSAGHNCIYVRSDYNSHGERAMAVVSSPMTVGDSCQAIGRFEYPESYEYTQYMSVAAQIQDSTAAADALYEITLTLGMGKSQLSVSGIVRNGESATLFFDVSEFSSVSMASYIRIGARPLSEDSECFSLLLQDVKGYSTLYGSEELTNLIEQKRLEIRNQNVDDGGGFNYTLLITIIGVVFALSAVAVGLMIVFKRDDDSDKQA